MGRNALFCQSEHRGILETSFDKKTSQYSALLDTAAVKLKSLKVSRQ